ncbi:MAG: ABC transporter transmembrane domain-containing protein, partial [Candidatus Thermoplasmatota archaeon]|nr:ABC transporter transmembrane domain-containing protein [Candidatus Thermoplasmatota archaeon]
MATSSFREHLRNTFSSEADDDEVAAAMAREDLSWTKAFGFIGRLLWRHPLLVVVSLLLGVGIAAAEIVSLGLIFPFIESLSGGGSSLASQSKLAFLVPYFEGFSTVDKVRFIAVGLVVVQLFKGTLKYISGRVTSYQRILLDRDLRQDIFDQIIALQLSYINQDKVANLYTILHDYASDTASSAKELLKGIPRVSSFAGYLIALLLLSWQLTLVALVLAAVTTKTINFLTNLIRRMSKRINVYRV